MTTQVDIYKSSLRNILATLRAEHNDDYVYRGQVQHWETPLVSSLYRERVRQRERYEVEGTIRLREAGTTFVDELTSADVMRLRMQPPAVRQKRERREQAFRKLIQELGYPMTQIFAQQAGLQSEGIDVTTDVDIAAFFATHDYDPKREIYHRVKRGTGVIYRFRVTEPDYSLNSMRGYDFYSSPAYLPSHKIIRLFEECADSEGFYASIRDYNLEYVYLHQYGAEVARTQRPFELIRFPAGALEHTRLIQQSAGLLLPDKVLSQRWGEKGIGPPQGKVANIQIDLIEDVSRRAGTTIYEFEHARANARQVKVDPAAVFPKDDVICLLIRAWFMQPLGLPSKWLLDTGAILMSPDKIDDLLV